MHYYKLESKEMDTRFLNEERVSCRVTLRATEQLQIDQVIIVMLSNGAKYKGKITRMDLIPMGNYTIGEMEVVRVAR